MSALLLLSGCLYRVAFTSQPEPAIVELPNGQRLSTPGEVRLRWAPYNHQQVRVTAAGYRPMEVDLRRHEIRLKRLVGRPFRRVKTEVDFVLVPAHGPTGTWDAEDLP